MNLPKWWYYRNKVQHNKNVSIFYGMYYTAIYHQGFVWGNFEQEKGFKLSQYMTNAYIKLAIDSTHFHSKHKRRVYLADINWYHCMDQ